MIFDYGAGKHNPVIIGIQYVRLALNINDNGINYCLLRIIKGVIQFSILLDLLCHVVKAKLNGRTVVVFAGGYNIGTCYNYIRIIIGLYSVHISCENKMRVVLFKEDVNLLSVNHTL